MKRTITVLSFLFLALSSSFAITGANWQMKVNSIEEFNPISKDLPAMEMDDFLNLSPKKYKEMTGKKMTFKEKIKLKAAQKFVKRQMKKQARKGNASDISEGLYIVLAIFGLAWIAMGVMDDWGGNNWIINILLTLLFWLPGFIHALIKKNEYF